MTLRRVAMAIAAGLLLQALLTEQWLVAAGMSALCAAAWSVPWLRHGVGSLALGGAGMIVGVQLDTALGFGMSCHDAGFWSVSTLGMVVGCTAACVAVCRLGGASGLNPVFHAMTLVGMFTGEQTAIALATALHQVPGHWVMTVGMAAGAAIGAVAASLVKQGQQGGAARNQLGNRGLVELAEHSGLGPEQ